MIKGKQSIAFKESPYIEESASVVGKKEGEGPLGSRFDMVGLDDMFGEDTWEKAESSMQKEACQLALGKAHLTAGAIRYLFGGDLLRQGVATSLGVEQLQIPMFGLYGACSTSGEALALASMCVAAGYGERMLVVTSSHFGSAEKEFRFPLSYANQRPLSAQWTVTGSGAFIVGKNRSHVRITGVTVGQPAIRSSGIWKILKEKKKIMTGSLPEISDMWDRAYYLILCGKKNTISKKDIWIVG